MYHNYRFAAIGTVLACLLLGLAVALAGNGPSAGAAYPTPPNLNAQEARLRHLSGVVAIPPWQVEAAAKRDALNGDLAHDLKRLLTPPIFGPNVDASLNNSSVQNETTNAINPEDNQRIIASANDYRANLQPWVYLSSDGGATWANYQVTGTTSLLYGDPAMAFGTNNRAYFSYLGYQQACGGGGGMYVSRSTDGGSIFSPPIQLAPNTHTNVDLFQDKEYVAVDNTPGSPYNGNVYVAWTTFVSTLNCNTLFEAPIVLSRSTNNGLSWSTPITASQPISNNNQSALPVIGRHGEVYLYYIGAQTPTQLNYDTVLFSRSTDGGQTFPFFTHVASMVDLPSPLPHGSFRDWGAGAMAADQTLDGYLHAVWADYRTGDADILLSRSTDNGNTWGAIQRVNDDPIGNGKDQFFPWIASSPDGVVHISWFDRREDPNDANYKEYYTYSTDHGATFATNIAVSAAPSVPGSSPFIGDYSGVAATSGVVIPVWTDIRTGGNQNAYVARGVYPPKGTSTPTHQPTCTLTPTFTSTATVTRTATVTGTPPTFTPTPTSICSRYYIYVTATGTIVPGTTDTGNHTDDGVTNISLPFFFSLYGIGYTSANVSSNGNLQFTGSSAAYNNTCLPDTTMGPAIFPHWDDLRTDTAGPCTNGCGIYTSVIGSVPNRIFNIEWRTYYFSGAGEANFEVRLYEGASNFDVILGTLDQGGTSATIGMQDDTGTRLIQFECNTSAPSNILFHFYFVGGCPTYTPTHPIFTGSPTRTNTPTTTPTNGPCVQPIQEGFESGTLGVFTSSGTPGWSAATSTPHSGTYSAFAPDLASVSDQRLTTSSPIVVPLNATQAEFSFWHRYNFDANGTTAFDGGVFEASTNGGATWADTGFTQGPYTHILVSCPTLNPLAGRAAWSGDSGGWVQTRGSLLQFRGRSVLLRFRLGTSETNGGVGWWIDDFSVTFSQSLCFSPTPTGGPSNTPTMTATFTPTTTPTNTPTATRSSTPIMTTTNVPSNTPTSPLSTITLTLTHTPTHTRTAVITATNTSIPTITLTATLCPINFIDVQPTDYFYQSVQYLYCAGVITGYADHTFRPYNNTTRGQLSKIVVLAEGWQANCPSTATFSDVPSDHPFFCFVETAYEHDVISGYSNGTFRPGNDVTRGQLCKIIVLAESWQVDCPNQQHFIDVPPEHPFYCFIETAYTHEIIAGYAGREFRPSNNATRGQICKIVYLAVILP